MRASTTGLSVDFSKHTGRTKFARQAAKPATASESSTAVLFRDVHAKLRLSRIQWVRRKLLSRTGRILAPYNADPNHAWYVIGETEFRSRRYNQATRAFKNALKHNPLDWMAMWAIANCYSEVKRPKLALRYYMRSFKIVRKSPALKYNIGNAYFDMRQYEDAIKVYRAVSTTDTKLRRQVRKNLELARYKATKEARSIAT